MTERKVNNSHCEKGNIQQDTSNCHMPVYTSTTFMILLHYATIYFFFQQGCIKGDLLSKNHFYKVFEHSCVAAVCENNQPIMLKIHQLIFFIKPINY